MGKLDNKIALVTGGTGGIGTAICQRLADDGAQIVTTSFGGVEKLKFGDKIKTLMRQSLNVMLATMMTAKL